MAAGVVPCYLHQMHLHTSTDRRTTVENPAFVAYVALHLAEDMKAAGNPGHVIAEQFAAALALQHGKMPEGVYVPEEDFRLVYEGLVYALTQHAAKTLAERASKAVKH